MTARNLLLLLLAPVAACGGGASSPRVSLLAPDAALEVPRGAPVEIRYVDDIAPDGGATSLYADADGDPLTEDDRVPIAMGRPGAGGAEQVVQWDTAAVPAGSWFLVAVSERDGRIAVAVTSFAVLVNAPPTVAVLSPDVETVVRPGGRLDVGYVDDDPDDAATTSLFLDGDGDLTTTGDRFVLAEARPDGNGAPQGAVAFAETAPDGLYFVLALATDGKNAPVLATGPGRVRVERGTWNEIHGPGGDDQAQHVAAFPDGSYAVAGRFRAPITLAEGTADETTLEADGVDVFLAKYDPRGRLAWARRVTGPGDQLPAGLAAFPDGSCALTGSSSGTAVLGEGEPGEARFGTLAFIGRYDADGRLRWARDAGSTVLRGAAALPGGALATTVGVQGAVTLNAGLPDARTFVAVGTVDGLLVRYEADGSLGWATRAGGPSAYVTLTDCASHADGSVAVVCAAYGTVTFGAGEPGETTFPGSVFSYVALAQYAPDGALRWARRARNDGGSQYFGDLRVAAVPDGGVAILGGFGRATTFGPGEPGETTLPGDAISLGVGFVARYAPDGALRWARQIGTASSYVTAIASSPAGEVVVAGYSGMPITFGGGEPSETTMVPAPIDLYFARYAEGDGRFLGVARFTFADAWWGSSGSRSALLFDAEVSSFPDGSLVVAATGGLSATFAPGTPAERPFTSVGGADVALTVLDRATLDVISD